MISRESDVRKAGLHEIAQFLAPRRYKQIHFKNYSNSDFTQQTKNDHMCEGHF